MSLIPCPRCRRHIRSTEGRPHRPCPFCARARGLGSSAALTAAALAVAGCSGADTPTDVPTSEPTSTAAPTTPGTAEPTPTVTPTSSTTPAPEEPRVQPMYGVPTPD